MQERSSESREDSTTSHDSCEILECTEETDDPFCSPRDFDEKAKRMVTKDWVGACKSLSNQMEESTITIEKFCARCRDTAAGVTLLPNSLLMKSRYALREYSRWCLQALKDLNSESGEKEELAMRSEEWEERLRRLAEEKKEVELEMARKSEEWEERTRRLAEERKEMELERDQLRASQESLRRLSEEWKEVELERDQLRAALATRGDSEGGRLLLPGTPNQRRLR